MPQHNNETKRRIMSQNGMKLGAVNVSESELENALFEVLRVGEFYDKRYGKFQVDVPLLETLKKNFDDNVLEVDVALDTNHEPEKGAMAWLKELVVKDNKLFARFRDFNDKAVHMLRQKVFRYFSVEFDAFTKIVDGKQVTIKDVLRGIALTNRPVIKGMAPTFLSEATKKEIIHRKNSMSAIKVFAQQLLGKDKVSKEDLNTYRLMSATLSEDEKEEVKDETAKVEAKAAETAAAEAEAEKAGSPEAVKASEAKALAEKEAKELAELREEKKAKLLSERTAAFILSENNLTGFTKAETDKVSAFVKTLSDEQATQFSELMKLVKCVDKAQLAELGSAVEGGEKKDGDEDKELAEIAKIADEIEKTEKVARHVALERAQKKVFAEKNKK